MTLGSGRRVSVLIFSTSIMKEVYLAPIEYYDPDMIFVLLSNRKDGQSQLEDEIYHSVKEQIQCNNIKEYRLDTHNFDAVAGTLIEIKRGLRKNIKDELDIFINISSGTNEYAAAGMFAAMTPPMDIAFNVIVENNGLSRDEMSMLLGDREHVISEPSIMTQIDKTDPDEEFVALLDILKEMLKHSKYTKYSDIISELKEYGVWSYDPERKSSGKKTDMDTKEERYLKRHYIDVALRNGWIKRPSPNTFALTPKGNAYLEVCRENMLPQMELNSLMSSEDRFCMMDAPGNRSVGRKKGKDALIVEHNGKSYRFTLIMK